MMFPAAKLIAPLVFVLFAAPFGAEAQPAAKVPRIGVLTLLPLSSLRTPREFPEALGNLGYVEGQNIILEWRSTNGNPYRLAVMAAELVRAEVDVIVTVTTVDTIAAQRATTTIPIVMIAAQDPIEAGLVASLARPGGNITGRVWFGPETGGKFLQILRETVPAIGRVVHVGLPSAIVRGIQASASPLGITLGVVEARRTDNVAQVLEEVDRWKPDALILSSAISVGHRNAILKYAVQHRLPTMAQTRGVIEAGALMGYISNSLEGNRRAAYYVDRILKGANPADLPIEMPQKYDLIFNLKTAAAIGLTISSSMLLRADELIE